MTSSSPVALGLKSDSFVSANERAKIQTRRAIVNVEGGQKDGKTDFCLRTFPGPIVIFNFDQGLEGVVEKHMKHKEIIVAGQKRKGDGGKYPSYHFARPVPLNGVGRKDEKYLELLRKAAVPMWEKFIADYSEFLSSKARTGVIDTGGAAFQLAKFAFIGMDKVTQKDDPYGQKGGEMKSIFQGLITDGYGYDKNVVWIHRLKQSWENGQAVNKQEADGYKQVPFEVQFTIRLKRIGAGDRAQRIAEIRDCRLGKGTELDGTRFGGKDDPPLDFPTIMTTLLPNTKYEEWE